MADNKQQQNDAAVTLDLRQYNLEPFTICLGDGLIFTMREMKMGDMKEFAQYLQKYKEASEKEGVDTKSETDYVAIDHLCYMFPGLTKEIVTENLSMVKIGKLYWEMRKAAFSVDRLKKKG